MKNQMQNTLTLFKYGAAAALLALVGCQQEDNRVSFSHNETISTEKAGSEAGPVDPVTNPAEIDFEIESTEAVFQVAAPVSGPVPLRDIPVDVGIRNFEQIRATMAALTGVPIQTAAIRTVFNDVKDNLPANPDVKSFLGSTQSAVSKLAVEFCDAMVASATLRATFYPGFNFGAIPATAFNDAGKATILTNTVEKLWGKGLKNSPDPQAINGILTPLLDQMIANRSVGVTQNAARTQNIVKGICSAVLASAPVILL